MTVHKEIPLAEQRQLLRQQLQAQRLLIEARLVQKEVEENSHPRSMIMRFLTQQNGLKIVAEGAAVLIGTRWLKSTIGRILSKPFQSLLVNNIKA